MILSEMRANVRRDLMDESAVTRFTDDQIDRAIARALTELSKYKPQEEMTALDTVSGSYEVAITTLTDRISVDKVEFPIDNIPRTYTRFAVYQDTLTLLETQGDGNHCNIYYSSVHTLTESASTIPAYLEDVVALGATAYAALAISQYATDKANYGGENVDRDYLYWAKGRLMDFEAQLKKLKSKVKSNVMYAED
jgi:hypothetical protein